jgi:predicted peptidase
MGKSKYGCLILFFFINSTIKSQNYEQLLTDAQSDIQEKNYCKAVEAFNLALKTQEGVAENNPFVFYTAATSAGYCGNNEYAIGWLSQAEKKGLVSKTEELSYVESDSAFIKLHALKEWSEIINSMKGKINEKKIQEDKLNKEWNSSILENVLNIKNKKKLSSKSKFVLYFTKVKDLEVPYLVYVPQKYNFKTPLKMIVYLHGGVVSLDKFNYDNFQIQQEPIFSVGEDLNAIVVYPFGKKDFGWVNQQKAFDNVFTVVDQVMKNFRIDKKNIILGGMSNGGTATFYYASQKPNVFKSFFAISSNPNVLLDRIKFSNLSQGKKIITLNSKDDNVYNFKEVENTYLKNKTIAKDWEFLSIEEGDHGFIYNPQKGKNILEEIIKKAFDN